MATDRSRDVESGPVRITRGGHVATGTSAGRRAKTAIEGTAKSAATRQALVAAASKVFVEVGYYDARVGDIVSTADVAHGSFYTYFSSKRDIFEAVVEDVGTMIRKAVAHTAKDLPDDPVASLEGANRRYLQVHRENARLLALVEQVSIGDPELQQFRISGRRYHVERIERNIKHLQARGLADPDIDVRTTAGALVSMLASFAHWSSLLPDEYPEDNVVRAVTDIWVRAIGLHSPSSQSALKITTPKSARTKKSGTVPVEQTA